ncbi:MAG: prolipoprotein diacylglyceryl transferase [Anaerolineae bacterium]
MNPVILTVFGIELRAFTFWIGLGVLLLFALLLRPIREQRLAHLDVLIGTLVVGVLGGRFGHVLIHWDYFSANTSEILALPSGGFDWHLALFGALLGGWVTARLRRVNFNMLLERAALYLPLLAACIWIACAESTAAYGAEVRTLADFPSWQVLEAPDIYGVIAPRYNLPAFGLAFSIGLFGLMLIIQWQKRLLSAHFWLFVLLYAAFMALIAELRGEPVPFWFGLRADFVMDVLVAGIAALLLLIYAVRGIFKYQKVQRTANRRKIVFQE